MSLANPFLTYSTVHFISVLQLNDPFTSYPSLLQIYLSIDYKLPRRNIANEILPQWSLCIVRVKYNTATVYYIVPMIYNTLPST